MFICSLQNPEHLLIFAAGNDGDDYSRSCTIGSPATGKNVLTVGASSSGAERLTDTGANGSYYTAIQGFADIDTVSYFSSYGPVDDGRIKPEVLAPGDKVLLLRALEMLHGAFRTRSTESHVAITGAYAKS